MPLLISSAAKKQVFTYNKFSRNKLVNKLEEKKNIMTSTTRTSTTYVCSILYLNSEKDTQYIVHA